MNKLVKLCNIIMLVLIILALTSCANSTKKETDFSKDKINVDKLNQITSYNNNEKLDEFAKLFIEEAKKSNLLNVVDFGLNKDNINCCAFGYSSEDETKLLSGSIMTSTDKKTLKYITEGLSSSIEGGKIIERNNCKISYVNYVSSKKIGGLNDEFVKDKYFSEVYILMQSNDAYLDISMQSWVYKNESPDINEWIDEILKCLENANKKL